MGVVAVGSELAITPHGDSAVGSDMPGCGCDTQVTAPCRNVLIDTDAAVRIQEQVQRITPNGAVQYPPIDDDIVSRLQGQGVVTLPVEIKVCIQGDISLLRACCPG